MSAMLTYMSVPDAYGVVEPGVYRAKAATAPNLPFLLNLRLRTLVYLSPDPLLPTVSAFLDKCATRFIHLGLRVWKPYATWKPVSEELIKDALEIVLDVNTHPIMVMCSSGIHQTGTVVGCLRRLQNWNLTSLLEEYRRYAGAKARYANEQFMELFDEDLVTLPRDLPAWFIDQRRMMREEEADFQRRIMMKEDEELRKRRLIEEEEAEFQKSQESSEDHLDESLSVTSVASMPTSALPSAEVPWHSSNETPLKRVNLGSSAEVNFWSICYLRSSPLTTESRSYKRKVIGKLE